MGIELGIIYGLIAGAGAAWRVFKGYQLKAKKPPYDDFSKRKALYSIFPAFAMAFVAGATMSQFPEIMTSQGLVLAMMLFTGGAGIGSLQGKLPKNPFKK